jgi:hypothetical protein
VYGRVFHVVDRLRIDKGCGRTTCGNRQSSSGRRSGSQPASRPTPRVCEARELLGERENHPRRSHNDYRKTHILRACTTGISSPEEFGEDREENQKDGLTIEQALPSGAADLNGHFAAPALLRLEAGDPIVILAGLHIGCFELFATHEVRTIRDLQGKTVAVPALDNARYVFLASMAAYVGLDPRKDLHVVTHPGSEAMRLLAEGKIDAYV